MINNNQEKYCILFSTADWNTSYWTNKQHTAIQLAKLGYKILYVESIGIRAPSASGKDLFRLLKRLISGLKGTRRVQPNIWVLSPLAIPFKKSAILIRTINRYLISLAIRVFMRSHGFNSPLIWSYHPFIRETIATFTYGLVVYHCVDDLAAIPRVNANEFEKEEKLILENSDVVFVTTQALRKKCEKFSSKVYYFSNVVDDEHFSRAHMVGDLPAAIMEIPSPRIGYVGLLSDYKIDFNLIKEIAQARPDWHWIFIGEEREDQKNILVKELKLMKNIHFIGSKPYSQLPEYMRGLHVGVLPTLINQYTYSMFPMKYYEFLAAGVPLVCTPIEFTKNNSDGMLIAEDSIAFQNAIAMQLERGRYTREESRTLVGDNTWVKRQEKMMKIIHKET